MALGEQLRDARRKMNLTASEVASATRVKVQLIEDIENENFERIAAPIYGKGFIKLYAEYVALDPRPLIAEYKNIVGSPAQTVSIMPEESAARGTEVTEQSASEPLKGRRHEEFDLFNETDAAEPEQETAPATLLTKESPADTVENDGNLEQGSDSASWISDVGYGLREAQAHFGRLGAVLLSKFQAITAERDPWKMMPMALGILVVLVFIVSGLSRCTPDVNPVGNIEQPSESFQLARDVPDPYFE
jgi:transcriptional regulator with XRE-family HTH domain